MAPTQKQQEAMSLYADLMEEAKIRFAAIDQMMNSGLPLPAPIISESCILQLRLLCEVIALGCLAAHGDIAKKSLEKEWAVEKIFRELETLHPDFYPHPVTFTITPPSPGNSGNVHLDRKTSGFLTKGELLTLYRKCGDRLHRGNIKKLLKVHMPIQTSFPDIAGWTNKIVALHDGHHIALLDNKRHFLCVLANASDNNRVQLAYAESPLT